MEIIGIATLHSSEVFDLTLSGAHVAERRPACGPAQYFALPLLADAHVHLDKTGTVGRTGPSRRGLMGAIDLIIADAPRWTADDIYARASAALGDCYAQGIGALRTHVDWMTPLIPTAWGVLGELKAEWKGRVALQRSALIPADMAADIVPSAAPCIARDGEVLGGFVLKNDNLQHKVQIYFDAAQQFDLALDFHVDETIDPNARGFEVILEETRKRRMAGRVTCGHVCSLAQQPPDYQGHLMNLACELSVTVISLPTTNLFLQDRSSGGTPRQRGLTSLREITAHGIDLCLANDNCRDPFYPYGHYDLLSVAELACVAGHMEPEAALVSVTSRPSRLLGLKQCAFQRGDAADFILLAAADVSAAVSTAASRRMVIREGQILPPPHTTLLPVNFEHHVRLQLRDATAPGQDVAEANHLAL